MPNQPFYIKKYIDKEALSTFTCGVDVMDNFIHNNLIHELQLTQHDLYLVYNDQNVVVALFVLCEGALVVNQDELLDIQCYHKPYMTFENNKFVSKEKYFTIEIAYLAVKDSLQHNGIGAYIIQKIIELAKNDNKHIITVDAFHNDTYSAVDFYKKCNFIDTQISNIDTTRMFLIF